MKTVKWILVSVVALLLAAVASTFFMSENFRVSQTQVIKASPEAVFNQLNTLKNWESWSYWYAQDDKMAMTYNDIASGQGASYSWKSDKKELGSGSLTIATSQPSAYLQCKLSFDGYGDSWSEYILKPVDGGTELTSAMNTETKGVFSKLMARLMMKPMMIKAFKASAEKMEVYLQANPDANSSSKLIDSVSMKLIDSVSVNTKPASKDCTVVKK
jgi:hypothetical protein